MGIPRNFNPEEKKRLEAIINDGIRVLEEIASLQEGLSETTNAIAEELDIRAAVLKKAIKTAHKSNFSSVEDDHQLLDNILSAVGRK